MANDSLTQPGAGPGTSEQDEPTKQLTAPPVAGAVPPAGGAVAEVDGHDRLGVHFVWEAVLALAVVAVGAALHFGVGVRFGIAEVPFLPQSAALLGLLAVAMAWSVRAAVPNLAVGLIAMSSSVLLAGYAETSVPLGIGVALTAAVGAAALITILTVALRAPAWAASLAVGVVVAAGTPLLVGRVPSAGLLRLYDPSRYTPHIFAGVAAISLLAGLLCLFGPIRRAVGAARTTRNPPEPRGAGGGFAATLAILGSCLVAAGAGMLLPRYTVGPQAAVIGTEWSLYALGAVLIGGVSLYGRRGGLFGTMLGVLLLGQLMEASMRVSRDLHPVAYAAAAIVVGLVVTRLIERFGARRAPAGEAAPGSPPVAAPGSPAL